ncbi:MAG: hypothetical protein L0206_04960, partial [Actinobacteria bacterium]|nr:hypothetical protein [Actinomycetota bacterium]
MILTTPSSSELPFTGSTIVIPDLPTGTYQVRLDEEELDPCATPCPPVEVTLDCGDSKTVHIGIQFEDLPPAITCPPDIVTRDPCVFFEATATDCDLVSVTYSQEPGTIFPFGTTVVTATAT